MMVGLLFYEINYFAFGANAHTVNKFNESEKIIITNIEHHLITPLKY